MQYKDKYDKAVEVSTLNRNIIKLFCILILPILIIAGCSTRSINIETANSTEQGNTNGNIKQMGFAVEKDGWIYYSVYAQGGLYKKRADGSEKQKLINSRAYEINVVGDFIYYE